MTHIAESQRFYYPDGKPAYEVPSADGKKMIKPDLRHARKLGLKPSVTTIMGILAKPALTQWLVRQGILAALTLPRNEGESDDSYIARLETDRKAFTEQRADEGTQIHKAIEQAIRMESYDWRWQAHVNNTLALLRKLKDELGTFVVDFKSKESLKGKTEKQLFFDEHVMQLAAYRDGIGLNRTDGVSEIVCETAFATDRYAGRIDCHTAIVYPSTNLVSILIAVDDGSVTYKIWTADEALRGMQMFNSCLSLYYLKNRL